MLRKPIARHFDFPLKPGRRQAALVVEDARCDIYESFDEARSYMIENIDWILQNFGETHHVGREDIMIVSFWTCRVHNEHELIYQIVGNLTAQHYAMVVSDFSPRTTIKFNVHAESARAPGEAWGTWSFVKQSPSDPRGFGSSSRQSLTSPPNSPGSPKASLPGVPPRPRVDERKVQYTCKVSSISGSPK